MKISRRASLTLLILGVLLLLGILFRSFIQDNFITPVSLVIWVFWRFLQSIDQGLYWGLLIFCILIFALVRGFEKPPSFEKTMDSGFNATLESMNFWRTMILITLDEIEQPNLLKRDLGRMLATIYSTKNTEVDYFETYNALRQGTIALPRHIYDFLYAAEDAASQPSLLRRLKAIRQKPIAWYRHWTRRDVADYYRSIEEVLTYMESLME